MRCIKLSEKDYAECNNFASRVVGTNVGEYVRRGQNNPETIRKQIIIGKLAEVGVSRLLNLTEPDFKVYPARKKSFAADLTDDLGRHYHVKCQEIKQSDMYGLSWVFQKTDPLVLSPTDRDILVFCQLDYKNCDLRIIDCVPALEAKDLFRAPKIEFLAKTKCVIYAVDLEQE